jgi:hypothetical protein
LAVPGLLEAFVADAALGPKLLEAQPGRLTDTRIADAVAEHLDDDALGYLIDRGLFYDTVASAAVRRGRAALARRGLEASAARSVPPRALAARELALLGERDEAKRLLASEEHDGTARTAILSVELGAETTAGAHAKLADRARSPYAATPTAIAGELVAFARWLVEHRPSDPQLDAVLATAGAIADEAPRTQYDESNVALRRSDVAALRTAVHAARGEHDQARAAAEAHLASLGAIQAAVRAPGDRRHEAWTKNQLAIELVGAAARAGLPEVARRAISKIDKAGRAENALTVASAFLPRYPGHALAALDAMAERPDDALLDSSRAPAAQRLLPALWSALLGR